MFNSFINNKNNRHLVSWYIFCLVHFVVQGSSDYAKIPSQAASVSIDFFFFNGEDYAIYSMTGL